MIRNLTRMDLVRLIRGCEPGMEYVNVLMRCGLGAYVGGMNDHWEWADKESKHWNDVSEEELWELYVTISNDNREEDNSCAEVYVVADYPYEYDPGIRAVFTDEKIANRYADAHRKGELEVYTVDLNPYFEEWERTWEVWMYTGSMEMSERDLQSHQMCVGYVRAGDGYITTWVIAKNSKEAEARASEVFVTVANGREQGKFRYLNQKIYLPDRKFPNIKKYPFYDVASGKIVLGDFGVVLLPKSEALLSDGTPNPDLFILLDRHFVKIGKRYEIE